MSDMGIYWPPGMSKKEWIKEQLTRKPTEQEQEMIDVMAEQIQAELDKEILAVCRAQAMVGDDKNKALLHIKDDCKHMREHCKQVLKGKKNDKQR